MYSTDSLLILILGLIAGFLTSFGFIPQLIRGYKTKKLDDVSYYFIFILALGMLIWLIYGILILQLPIIVANAFGVGFCISLIILKYKYSK